ncbi:MAG: hypothetical protein N3A66_02945, partial [Planctomycetota bacterium]|nr:hypothetical protein [Planctomycetota bacterium]
AYANANAVKEKTTACHAIIDNLFNDGAWYAGQSYLFHAIIRGQVYDTLRLQPIAEANLEIVYCNNPSTRRILYQRWVSKTR